jgi:hypothetical protein
MTPPQLDESAKAPWTRTTVSGALKVASDESSFLRVDVDDRLGGGLRRVLRHVVADAGPRTSPRRTPGRDAARRWRRLPG